MSERQKQNEQTNRPMNADELGINHIDETVSPMSASSRKPPWLESF